jgi:hypothetical protein
MNKQILFFEFSEKNARISENIQQTKVLLEEIIKAWGDLSQKPLLLGMIHQFTEGNSPGGSVNLELIITWLKKEIAEKMNLSSPYFDETTVLSLMKAPDISVLAEKLQQLYSLTVYWQCFSIKDGQVEIKTDEVEKVKDFNRLYASTAPELERLAMVDPIVQAMDKIREKYNIPIESFSVPGLIFVHNGKLYPGEKFVKKGNLTGF